MSVPLSTIYIMGPLPIDNRYEHSLYFNSEEDQFNYFFSKKIATFQKYTYLRKNWKLKVEADMDIATWYSYLMFRNHKNDRWWYYFITKVEYVNDETVELTLELDVIQTFLFDMRLKDCFVERMHTFSDDIGEHTVDEGLETGMLTNAKQVDVEELKDMCILVLSAVTGGYSTAWAEVYDGVFSGLRVYAVLLEDYIAFGNYLDSLSEAGSIDSIVAMWMYPKNLVQMGNSTNTLHGVTGAKMDGITIPDLESVKKDLFEGYDVKNNKLYSYPFNFLYCTNNAGGSAVYRFERFIERGVGKLYFACYGALSPDADVKIAPCDYNLKGSALDANFDEGLSMGAYPSCAWDSDTYKVWLAQNQHTQSLGLTQAKISAGMGAVASVASIASGNVVGAGGGLLTAYHGFNQVQGLMAQRADMEIQPPQARGAHSATVNVANDKQTFTFYYKCLSKEYARIVDEYFTRYGYKLNRVMQPVMNARPHFTYVKTIGCLVDGYLEQEDKVKIQSIFDNGITFWKNPKEVGDYSVNNAPD